MLHPPRLQPTQACGMQSGRWDRDSARTRSETLPSRLSLHFPAAARLFPDSPIKALDPAGTSASYCCITTKGPEVTEKCLPERNFRAKFISPHRPYHGNCRFGLSALMPRTAFRLTGLEGASKLFFPHPRRVFKQRLLPDTSSRVFPRAS